MVSLNFTRTEYDHYVYFKKLENDIFIILVLYIDDMLVASKRIVEIHWLKPQLAKTFDMKDLGVAKQILAWRYKETGKMVSFGYHNRSMWRKYL
jgi:hypothetical protein